MADKEQKEQKPESKARPMSGNALIAALRTAGTGENKLSKLQAFVDGNPDITARDVIIHAAKLGEANGFTNITLQKAIKLAGETDLELKNPPPELPPSLRQVAGIKHIHSIPAVA